MDEASAAGADVRADPQPRPPTIASSPPAAADRAKDFGLINIAYTVTLVVGPLVAGVLLGLTDCYPVMFTVAAVVTMAAAGTTIQVRSVA